MHWGKILKNIYVGHLFAAALVLAILITAVLLWLNSYTQHGEAIEVPDVKGLQIEKAEPFFTNKELYYQIIDSVFSKGAVPGSIIETIPPIGSKVKKGRTIYLKINSFIAQSITVPDVKDLSLRHALALLQSIGFEKVEVKSVPGIYRDLVIDLESRGHTVAPGGKIPANTPLSLLVSSGYGTFTSTQDTSVVLEGTPDESWF
jgi:beta-lactam-binding protein with PASTA domain